MAVALVTGCSSGNGLATAVALARAGHTVAATMRRLDRGADIEKIADGEKLPIYLAAVDVNDDESVRSGFAKVVRDLGPIDALVNNAGIPGGMAVEETSLETFRSVMETNFFGALRCIKAVVPAMRERRSGIIVNITSISGRIASASQSSYAASKWALEALSESLAQEMRPFRVRVAIVEPGVIATSIFGKAAQLSERHYPYRKRIRALIEAALEKLGRLPLTNQGRHLRARCSGFPPLARMRAYPDVERSRVALAEAKCARQARSTRETLRLKSASI